MSDEDKRKLELAALAEEVSVGTLLRWLLENDHNLNYDMVADGFEKWYEAKRSEAP